MYISFNNKALLVFAAIIFVAAIFSVHAQTRKQRIPIKKTEATATPKPTPAPAVPQPGPEPPKKNERPGSGPVPTQSVRVGQTAISDFPYRYEFSQPEFLVDRIIVQHDETGKGKIFFSRKGYDELVSDPIQLSVATMGKLNTAFDALNFVDSIEDYQFEHDFSNIGNVEITLKKNGRQRTAKYNWTTNKDAKFLMDEYRRIANQFIWMFDINLARENQPLETPKLVDSFDSLMKRNEIADLKQMIPFLEALSNDERIPLIGRNHAGKLIKQIEKQKN